MTDEELRDAARKIWSQFNAHDLDLAGPEFAPNFENANALPGTPPGPEGMRQVAERLYSAFPDMRFEIEEIFVAEQRVATRLSLSRMETLLAE
jgi:predicted ester cyclase